MLVETHTEAIARRVPAAVRALAAALLGLAALGAGVAVFLARAVLAGVGPVEVLGILLIPAGVALLAAAGRIALRGRRWWVAAVVALAAAAAVVQWWVVPALDAGLVTNAAHPSVPSASTLGLAGARDVTFATGDGMELAGWYVPGANGTAVVLAHGAHDDRRDTVDHLRLLARAGYAVLAFDARGHGESGGATNALGWQGGADVAGAVAFARRQPGIERVAVLGLSMGAEAGLRAAAAGVPLAAVVADGAGASTAGDQRLLSGGVLPASVTWLALRGVELLGGGDEPPALADVAGRIRVPVLLVASGARDEYAIDAIYRRRIGARAALWSVPDAAHTQALERHPAAYAARVLGLLGSIG